MKGLGHEMHIFLKAYFYEITVLTSQLRKPFSLILYRNQTAAILTLKIYTAQKAACDNGKNTENRLGQIDLSHFDTFFTNPRKRWTSENIDQSCRIA